MKALSKGNKLNNFSLLLFTTPNCNPCKNMKKVVEALEKDHGDKLDFYLIDLEKTPEFQSIYNIKSVPTTILIKEGKIKERFAGLRTEDQVESSIMNLIFDIDQEMSIF